MKKFAIIATLVTVSATLFSNVFASFLFSHQPVAPKCLTK